MHDFSKFKVFTFDCYGTLIDWETGILNALRPLLQKYGRNLSDAGILELYAALEQQIEAGEYKTYRRVLEDVVKRFGAKLVFTPTAEEVRSFPESLQDWPPFADTHDALMRLRKRFKLAIISNVDDDLFAYSARLMGVPFDHIITAQQVQSYKPAKRNFETALEKLGVAREQVLHCAESRYHDIAPTNELGIANVWVNRHASRPGASASGSALAEPGLMVPDMKSLADAAGV